MLNSIIDPAAMAGSLVDAATPIPSRPPWLVELRKRIDECQADARLDLIANVFEFRRPSELPRPGEVAHYEHRDWDKLANDFGLEVHGKTTHSHMFRHKQLRFIVLSPAGTSGDVRGAMNTMSDFRASYRREIGSLLVAVDVALSNPESNVKSLEDFKIDIIASMNNEKLPVMMSEIVKSKSRLGLTEPISLLTKYLRIIKSEFGLSFDRIFEICRIHGDNAEECLFYAKNPTLADDMLVATETVSTVRDFLETLRKEDRIAREKKRAEREARYAPKPIDPVDELKVNTGEGKYRDECNKYGAEMSKIGDMITGGIARLLQLKIPTPPLADYSVHEEKIRSLTAHVAETEQELLQANDESEKLRQALHESESTNPWEGRMRDLVEKLNELLADNDITNLLTNLKEARKRLEEARTFMSGTIPPTYHNNSEK